MITTIFAHRQSYPEKMMKRLNRYYRKGELRLEGNVIRIGPHGRRLKVRFGSDLARCAVEILTQDLSRIYSVTFDDEGYPVSGEIACAECAAEDEGWYAEWVAFRPVDRRGAGFLGICWGGHKVAIAQTASGGFSAMAY